MSEIAENAGRFFNHIGGAPICPACREKEEEDFQRVKKYLYENPGASLTQVSTELEISVEMIKKIPERRKAGNSK